MVTVPGEGMPNSKTGLKGDLRVKFLVQFPDFNDADRKELGNVLQRCERK